MDVKSKELRTSTELHMFGITENEIKDKLKEIMESSNGLKFEFSDNWGEITVRITALCEDISDTQTMLKTACDAVRKTVGDDAVFGIDVPNLQTALVRRLEEKSLKIATAESCTGGLVSKRITDVAGAGEVFECGICSYANEIKEKLLGVSHETLEQYTAVSHQTAEEMANGVRILANADIGISTTGYAGPSGGTDDAPVGTVYIGISTKTKTVSKKLTLGQGSNNKRDCIRNMAASNILFEAIQCVKLM